MPFHYNNNHGPMATNNPDGSHDIDKAKHNKRMKSYNCEHRERSQ